MNIATQIDGWIHNRELLVDGKKVSWLRVQDYTMRIGSARVRMGGIADVGTDSNERMKGYSRRLMEDSVTYMTDQNFDVTMLFGIRNYYHKFGYAVCVPSVRHTMSTRDAEAAGNSEGAFRIRDYAEDDLESLLDLYDDSNSRRTCTLIRPREYYKGIRKGSNWGRRATTIVVENTAGQFAGYAAYDQSEDDVTVTEVEAWDPAAFPTLLHQFAKMAIDRRCGELTFLLPQDHLFAEYLRRSECRTTMEHPKCGGGMMRILNQDSLFQKLQGELGRRVSASEARNTNLRLGLRTDLGDTLLDIQDGQVEAIPGETSDVRLELPQSKLMQLVLGYRSARSLMSESDVNTRGDVLPIIEALFPVDHPYVWKADYF